MSQMRIHAKSPLKNDENKTFFVEGGFRADIHVLEDGLKVTDGSIMTKDIQFPYKFHFYFKNVDRRDGSTELMAALGASGYGDFSFVATGEAAFKAGIVTIEVNPFEFPQSMSDELVEFVLALLKHILEEERCEEVFVPEDESDQKNYISPGASPRYITVPEIRQPDDGK